MVAPTGMVSMAELRASAAEFCVRALARPSFGSSARQKRSGAVSSVFAPQPPTVPTTGARAEAAHSWAEVLPIQVKSPFWLTCTRRVGAALAAPTLRTETASAADPRRQPALLITFSLLL